MTRFFLDNKEISPPLDAASLAQILKHVEDAYLPANSVVRKIQIDGRPLMAESFSESQPEMLSQILNREQVEIFTATLSEIANDSIAEARSYLDRIEAAIPSLAESFRISPDPEAFRNLRQLCEGFYWLNILLDKLKTNFQLQFENMPIQGISAAEYHQRFISILHQLVESQQTGDFVLISDLLEYEILPLVPIWKEMLGAVLAKMNMTQ